MTNRIFYSTMAASMITVFFVLFSGCSASQKIRKQPVIPLPDQYRGEFVDDYDISYQIDSSLFIISPNDRFHIVKWNPVDNYFLVQNDSLNTYAPGLFGRIDVMNFEAMAPYTWGFCMIAYEAKSLSAAEQSVSDRAHPKTGCSGFPFTRMKRVE